MSAIRVLVVEDSLTVRKRLVEVLQADPGFEVIGEAADGKEGIELCQSLRPDVITLDMMMPVMTGLTATEYIMAYCPTPILIVSASVNRSEALRSLDALAAGAVEILDKPPADEALHGAWERLFLDTLRLVSRVKVITHPRARLQSLRLPQPASAPLPRGAYELVAIGTSTGGPAALMRLLPALPQEFSLPILLVVHIDPRFDASFLDWLEGISELPVHRVVDHMPLPRRGQRGLWLAPGDHHLVVRQGRLRLTQTRERNSCRPSADELFESVARELGPRAIGCLLTGMGADGAEGLLAMRRAGAMTLAQDEASSVVFGMPAEAIRRGAALRVLPLEGFAPSLAELARSSGGTP